MPPGPHSASLHSSMALTDTVLAVNRKNTARMMNSVGFTLKCHLIVYPEATVLFFFFGTVFASAYLVRIFEIPFFRTKGDPVFDNYFDSVWFTRSPHFH